MTILLVVLTLALVSETASPTDALPAKLCGMPAEDSKVVVSVFTICTQTYTQMARYGMVIGLSLSVSNNSLKKLEQYTWRTYAASVDNEIDVHDIDQFSENWDKTVMLLASTVAMQMVQATNLDVLYPGG